MRAFHRLQLQSEKLKAGELEGLGQNSQQQRPATARVSHAGLGLTRLSRPTTRVRVRTFA